MTEAIDKSASYGTQLWTYLETELHKGNALLLPLRLFIGLGWLRAGVEKIIDPMWRSGDKLTTFFQTQLGADAVYFPFYEALITQFFALNPMSMSWIVMFGELLAGIAILTGTLTTWALLGGLFMNLNFVLAGVVNPSAFYIVIQGTLLSTNAGATLSGDSFLARYGYRFLSTSSTASNPKPAYSKPSYTRKNASGPWLLLLNGILCTAAATLVTPYIRDFGPHSIEDPAMLLFILLMLGAMLSGIQFIRATTRNRVPGQRTQQTLHV
ncbi:MAG: DoxX family protein [Chloroflexota bacterium]